MFIDVYVMLKLEIKRKVWSHSLVLRADIWTEVFSDLSRLTKERQNGICLNFLTKNWQFERETVSYQK